MYLLFCVPVEIMCIINDFLHYIFDENGVINYSWKQSLSLEVFIHSGCWIKPLQYINYIYDLAFLYCTAIGVSDKQQVPCPYHITVRLENKFFLELKNMVNMFW